MAPPPERPNYGTPPFFKVILPPRKKLEYAAIGYPIERLPLGLASLDFCPWAQPGDLVSDKTGRWCIVVDC